jgi:glycosyltransferase involved in cell wall biosynthesis
MPSPITGVVITLNEEANIAECVRSLQQVCQEVIVVDSSSRDRTLELAAAEGARVVEQAYLGDGPQKNAGPQLADGIRTRWCVCTIVARPAGLTCGRTRAWRRPTWASSTPT